MKIKKNFIWYFGVHKTFSFLLQEQFPFKGSFFEGNLSKKHSNITYKDQADFLYNISKSDVDTDNNFNNNSFTITLSSDFFSDDKKKINYSVKLIVFIKYRNFDKQKHQSNFKRKVYFYENLEIFYETQQNNNSANNENTNHGFFAKNNNGKPFFWKLIIYKIKGLDINVINKIINMVGPRIKLKKIQFIKTTLLNPTISISNVNDVEVFVLNGTKTYLFETQNVFEGEFFGPLLFYSFYKKNQKNNCLKNLKELYLTGNFFKPYHQIIKKESEKINLKNLKRIELKGTYISSFLNNVSCLENVEFLKIIETKGSVLDIFCGKKFFKLKKFSLHGKNAFKEYLKISSMLSEIETLQIIDTKFEQFSNMHFFKCLRQNLVSHNELFFSSIKKLVFSGSKASILFSFFISNKKTSFKNLTHLHINENDYYIKENESIKKIKFPTDTVNLKKILLRGHGVYKWIREIKNFTNLQYVFIYDFSYNENDNTVKKKYKPIDFQKDDTKNLKYLSISGDDISKNIINLRKHVFEKLQTIYIHEFNYFENKMFYSFNEEEKDLVYNNIEKIFLNGKRAVIFFNYVLKNNPKLRVLSIWDTYGFNVYSIEGKFFFLEEVELVGPMLRTTQPFQIPLQQKTTVSFLIV